MTSTTTSARVLLDTNVLLSATDDTRPGYDRAVELIADDERELVVTIQVAREYLSTATRPVSANGFGLPGDVAVANLEDLLMGVEVLPDSAAALAVLAGFVHREMALGKQIHDANLVAQALHHRLDVIVTDNARHFHRFADLIAIEALVEEDER